MWGPPPGGLGDVEQWRSAPREWVNLFPANKAQLHMLGHPRVWADVVRASEEFASRGIFEEEAAPAAAVEVELDDIDKVIEGMNDDEYVNLVGKSRTTV